MQHPQRTGRQAEHVDECTAFPTFASRMLPRLYDERSRVRYAFTSIGSVLAAKISVDAIPAMIGRLLMT